MKNPAVASSPEGQTLAAGSQFFIKRYLSRRNVLLGKVQPSRSSLTVGRFTNDSVPPGMKAGTFSTPAVRRVVNGNTGKDLSLVLFPMHSAGTISTWRKIAILASVHSVSKAAFSISCVLRRRKPRGGKWAGGQGS